MEYLAVDCERADRVMKERFGDVATIRYRGASNYTFCRFPSGSWLSNGDRLHVFYGLPRNGERPSGCEAFETESAVIVSLRILDLRGPKTLVGGFIASQPPSSCEHLWTTEASSTTPRTARAPTGQPRNNHPSHAEQHRHPTHATAPLLQ